MNNIETSCPTELPKPLSAYSHTSTWGDLVFIAGQLPLRLEDGAPLTELDASEQTEVVMSYLEAALKEAGSTIENVLKTTVYVASLDDYAAVNEVYGRYFSAHQPARATIQAGALIGGTLVEIDAIALKTTPANEYLSSLSKRKLEANK